MHHAAAAVRASKLSEDFGNIIVARRARASCTLSDRRHIMKIKTKIRGGRPNHCGSVGGKVVAA
jgi:hypothetical protein